MSLGKSYHIVPQHTNAALHGAEATHITMKMYSSIIDRISVFVVRAQARGLAAGGSVLVKRPGNQSHPVWLMVGLYTGRSMLVTRPGNQSHAVWLLVGLYWWVCTGDHTGNQSNTCRQLLTRCAMEMILVYP